nr:MAG TPA: hypothetical protein [Caudoviricetes sp.]
MSQNSSGIKSSHHFLFPANKLNSSFDDIGL